MFETGNRISKLRYTGRGGGRETRVILLISDPSITRYSLNKVSLCPSITREIVRDRKVTKLSGDRLIRKLIRDQGGQGVGGLIAISRRVWTPKAEADSVTSLSWRWNASHLFPLRASSLHHRQESCSLGEAQGVISHDNVWLTRAARARANTYTGIN